MSGAFLLFRLSLKRVRMLLCVTGLLLAGFQALRVHIAASHSAGEFEQIAALLPPSVRTILGPSLTSVMSFNGIVCGGYFDLGIVIALVVLTITLATLPAFEIETGFADLILARPMRRHWLITRTIALVLFSILLMLFMIMAGTWAGLALFAPPAPPGRRRARPPRWLSIWRCCCCAGAALPWPSAPLAAPASRARPRPCSPSPLCSWTMLNSCGRRSSASAGCRHFGISPRSNWSWATHCPWKISWSSGRLP